MFIWFNRLSHMKQDPNVSMVKESVAIYGGTSTTVATEAVEQLESGLPMMEFESLQELLGLSMETLGEYLSMSRSTLMRRKKAGRLDALESDRLLRYARIYGRSLQVFGDAGAALAWLSEPARALGFRSPLTFAKTEFGAREVENLLGRLEHGIFN